MAVAAVVAGGADDHQAGIPDSLDGLDQRIGLIALFDRLAQRKVDDTDVVICGVVEDPVESSEDVGAQASTQLIEHANRNDSGTWSRSLVGAGRQCPVTTEDAGNMGAVSERIVIGGVGLAASQVVLVHLRGRQGLTMDRDHGELAPPIARCRGAVGAELVAQTEVVGWVPIAQVAADVF